MGKKSKTFDGKEIEYQADELGYTTDGLKVTAATDAAGPQVIVVSKDVHLLSKPLANHAAAVELGKKVVAEGVGVYKEWYDLKNGSVGLNIFAVFGGPYRG